MKQIFYSVVVVSVVFLHSCHVRETFFTNNIKIISNQFQISKTLEGEILPISNVYNISSFVCFDDYLLLLTPRADKVFNVYSFDGKLISRFGTFGRANDELMNCQFNGQTVKIGRNNCIWINDVSKARLVLIDIDKSIEVGRFIILKELVTPPMSVYSFYVNDSVLISEQLTGNNYELVTQNILSGNSWHEVLYEDFKDAFSLYKSTWCLDNNRNRLIGAMRAINQINFYSLDDYQRMSVVIGNPCTNTKELIDEETGLECTVTFCDIEVTDSYIYALYMNQNYEDAYEKPKPQDVLVLDMDGNLVQVLRIDEYIYDIAVSQDKKYLYGRTSDEVYRYEL